MKQDSVNNDLEKTRSSQVDDLNPSDAQSGISGSRRRFSSLTLGAAPIVVSLVSKPVFGAQCLSNMMSGNLSHPDRGNCSKGSSPGGWGQPGGTIQGVQDAQAWTQARYNPEGTVALANLPAGLLTQSQSPVTKTLRAVLLDTNKQRDRHVLAAWLNAKFSENSGGTFYYILTSTQVLGLANGSLPLPPPYVDLNTFLDSTWT